MRVTKTDLTESSEVVGVLGRAAARIDQILTPF